MTRMLDGPAEGTYMLKRAPLYVRAVVADDGVSDVLDQLTDAPRKNERVSVYRRVTEPIQVHLNRGRHGSGFYVQADYRHMPEVDGETLRDNAVWREWAEAQP